ncbi:MAG: YdcF family protein [Acidimicrobiia bacterium]
MITKRITKKKILLLVVILFVSYIFYNFAQVYYFARNDQVTSKTKADAILVLGAAQFNGKPSKVLQARLDHAIELYKQKTAPVIIVTGGNQPGDITTEASASANYLLKHGVRDENILREVRGKSTYDSIRDAEAFSKPKGIKKIVIVTDGFHEFRSRCIAQDFGFKVVSSPAKNSPISGKDEFMQFIGETGRVSLGKIIGFRRVSKDSSIVNLI